jgi:peptidoglycan/LPS O-acetylase OafA/YrhL
MTLRAGAETAVPTAAGPLGTGGGYLGQFDSYRVIACGAVVLQHSLLWTVTAGNVMPWAFVMLLHFSRTAFFFLTAFLITYAQLTRPRSTLSFWRHRFIQLGVPYLAWTGIYWIYTMLSNTGSGKSAGWLLWHDVVFGYYQLYFAVVIFQLYLVFPLLLWALRKTRRHLLVMALSGAFALVLAADLHWSSAFGALGGATRWISAYWPWSRNPLTYQEQFLAGVLVALHFDQVRRFVATWYRQMIFAAALIGVAATLWYLVAVWVGSGTGPASDLYQPIAFVWFAAAVVALECGTWWSHQRPDPGRPRWSWAPSASSLAALTGGIFLSHVLFINLVRSALGGLGLTPHLGWAGEVLALFVLTFGISALFIWLVLRTPLRWVLGGPVRTEQRARIDATFAGVHRSDADDAVGPTPTGLAHPGPRARRSVAPPLQPAAVGALASGPGGGGTNGCP